MASTQYEYLMQNGLLYKNVFMSQIIAAHFADL